MVLLSSLIIPAHAVSWIVVNPADHISSTYRENGIDYVSFNFNSSPLIEYSLTGYSGDTLTGTAQNSVSLNIDHSYGLPLRLWVYPLGKKYEEGSKLTSSASGQIAIDVHDFKPSAAVTVNANLYLHLDYIYDTALNASASDYLGLTWYIKFFEYDANGNCVNVIIETVQGVYGLDPQTTQATLAVPLQKTIEITSMHEDTRYVVPFFRVGMSLPQNVPDIELRRVDFSAKAFFIQTQTDMIMKDSLTLEAIEKHLEDLNDKTDVTNEKLDDLNDKADTIINGEQYQQSNAQDGAEQVGQNQQDMDDILAQLDDYEKLDTTTAMDAIKNFLEEDGWRDVRELISPVIDWTYTITIMLIILSLINLSIILFGR